MADSTKHSDGVKPGATKPLPTSTNEIGFPQYERSLNRFYMWTSGGSLKDKLAEFAIRYEGAESIEDRQAFIDYMYDAIIGFFSSQQWVNDLVSKDKEATSE